jgi:branched-subunit amino acid transport protein
LSTDLILLALLMAAVTYPSRALPLLAPGIERLPDPVLAYLRLIGPGCLAALAAVNVLVVRDATGSTVRLGIEPVAVLVCVAVVIWTRSLLLGVIAAVALVIAVRALGLG